MQTCSKGQLPPPHRQPHRRRSIVPPPSWSEGSHSHTVPAAEHRFPSSRAVPRRTTLLRNKIRRRHDGEDPCRRHGRGSSPSPHRQRPTAIAGGGRERSKKGEGWRWLGGRLVREQSRILRSVSVANICTFIHTNAYLPSLYPAVACIFPFVSSVGFLSDLLNSLGNY